MHKIRLLNAPDSAISLIIQLMSLPEKCQAIIPEEADRETRDTNQKALDIAQRLHSVFTPNHCECSIIVYKHRGNDLKDFVNRTFELPFNSVGICADFVDDSITVDEANFLINTVPSSCSLTVNGFIPIDFQNEKAFKFNSVYYSSAGWVSFENLIAIRNSRNVGLGFTSFDISDINNFLHYWINCEEEMMKSLNLHLKKDRIENAKEVLATLVCIKARNDKNRKRILGKLTIQKRAGHIVFTTFEDKESSRDTLKALENVQKHKNLNLEIREMKKEEIEKRKIHKEMEEGNPLKEEALKEAERLRYKIKESEKQFEAVRRLLIGRRYRYTIP
uniref:FBA_2 domain-containing protein n=1 Tax=Caenorhabditis tropicalis TaxID=1561998 RepID=A0A1I7UC73_9PELO